MVVVVLLQGMSGREENRTEAGDSRRQRLLSQRFDTPANRRTPTPPRRLGLVRLPLSRTRSS